jgi:UDP-N-acetylmuramate--alanine ligase
MAAHVLLACGRDPAFLVGGEVRPGGPNARWGEGDWIVVEADESDRSFLELAREVAVVTNVELDHHSTYRSLGELEQAFAEFAAPATVRVLGPGVHLAGEGEAVTFGIEAGHLRAEDVELLPGGSRFSVGGVAVELAVPGRHNVLNALAAIAATGAAGVAAAEAAPALTTFGGAGRRFEHHGRTASGGQVVDDYAHHPTEVRATLEAARTLEPRRLVACFQPHLYSRTGALAREFGRALALADVGVVLDVYPARERPEDFPGVSGLLVAQAAADAARGRPVWWLPDMGDAERLLRDELREGDLLVTLGAGDVDRLARALGETEPVGATP